MARAIHEFADFIARGATRADLVAFEPSEAVKERVAELIRREKASSLTPEERAELDASMWLEHLVRLVKARARRGLGTP